MSCFMRWVSDIRRLRLDNCLVHSLLPRHFACFRAPDIFMTQSLHRFSSYFVLSLLCMLVSTVQAQVCAAPGKDGPASPTGIMNIYYQGNGNLAAAATTLTLGAASGAAGTVTVGDKLIVMQMQGADIDSNDDERYGDGTGTAGNRPDTTASQANGYTSLNLTGGYEYVQVTAAAGNAITFVPALTNAYQQNTGAQPRRTYQVIRVPQYSSATISSASPLLPLAWSGLVGGVVAIDVAGRITFTGAGPHIEASNRGFRGGNQGVNNSAFPSATRLSRSVNTADGGGKGEGIAGTPRYLQTSTAGGYNSGTRFSDVAPTQIDNGAGNLGYNLGDYQRGAPANAGGGGNSHNAAGGGGGNGGEGGNGGQTYDGDGLNDTGGYGGSRTPKDGVLLSTRLFMGGAGGSGSLNNSTAPRGSGGNGGGIIMVRVGSISGSGILRSDGQRAWDSDTSNDAGGGGGAGGSVLFIAGSGHNNITVQARGGDGADSNLGNNTAFAPPNGTQDTCCGNELEGPGGGGGGGAVYANSTLGALSLGGGVNGLSRANKAIGSSGNMRASPGSAGNSAQALTAGSIVGAREGYACIPALTVNKLTNTPALTVPPDTSGTYIINIRNSATLSGVAYGVAITDVLSSPFRLTGTTATINYSAGASGPASPMTVTGTGTVAIGTAGSPTNAFTLVPGANVTATFKIGLNGATAGTYQNPATVNYTDPARTTGGAATAVTNAAVTPGGTDGAGNTVPGSNYASGSSTQEDIVITGTAGTTADLGLTKSGPASVEVGQVVQYTLTITNNGPSNVTGSITITDNVPAAIGTVSWVCTITAGVADCDTLASGSGSAGSGNTIALNRVSMNSGGQLNILVQGTAVAAGTITNTATVAVPAGYTDPTLTNNTGTATTVISTPTADLSVTKSNGVSSVFANGVTAYTIVVSNAGPSAASNAVVTDPARAGLTLVSVTCSGAGGAVCPSGLTTSTFQAGATIPTFPAGGALTFTANNSITAGSGTVTNTVTVTAPPGLNEINTANNTATDTDAVTVATSAVTSAAQICPAGTTEQLSNLLSNSDYANTAASVGALVNQAAADTQATNTSVSVQSGPKNYGPNVVTQAPFPGDSARSVGSANNWLYSKGNNSGAAYRFWSQTVSGLVVGRTYEWLYYGSNALNRGSAAIDPPTIEMRAQTTTTFTLVSNSFPNEGAGTSDTWTLRQSIFGATATSVTLQLWDTVASNNNNGDNLASTQVILRECKPNTDPLVTKTNNTNTLPSFSTTNYLITVANNGPGPADGIIVKDPITTGLNKTAISCAAFGSGSACPPSSTVSGIEGAGLTIPSLPINTTVLFTITASVTALNGTVTNTVSLQLPLGMTDNNLANNSAADVDAIKGQANLSVAKTNGVSSLAAGSTTAYTVTVANSGPSDASGAVVSDPVTAGLSCVTAATCTASGGASCAASIPITTIQSGYTIPALPSGGQISIRIVCGVSATGQ